MAFPSSITDIIATTIESRTKKIADNVTKNNALLARLNQRGNIKTVSGGSQIFEEISFAENGNGGAYSGYDLLPVAAQDVITAAAFQFKQYAVPVVISGLEQIQNSGREAMIDLMEARLAVAESTMANLLSAGIYADGTGYGGKAITGLDAAVPNVATASQTNTYGGINRTNWAFWRSYAEASLTFPTADTAATNIQQYLNRFWSNLVRGSDRPDLIIMDNNYWAVYMQSLQAIQRFTSPDSAQLGFPSIKYQDADVVLDGGIGGFAYTDPGSATGGGTAYMLNTKYLKWRPHADRNMVPLSPNRRYAINQDAEVQILAWAGNLTCSGAKFQGRIQTN
jgi:hypothetical protein